MTDRDGPLDNGARADLAMVATAVGDLLRQASAWVLTDTQAADLDEILTELAQAVADRDRIALVRIKGDLSMIDDHSASRWAPMGEASRAPLRAGQRERIAQLVPVLLAASDGLPPHPAGAPSDQSPATTDPSVGRAGE